MLKLLNITVEGFKIAGGIVLLVVSLRFMVTNYSAKKYDDLDQGASAMIIGIPMITGPGVLTTTIIIVGIHGYVITLISALIALFVVRAILQFSKYIHLAIGDTGMEIVSRIMGLLLTAVAVEFIKAGIIRSFGV